MPAWGPRVHIPFNNAPKLDFVVGGIRSVNRVELCNYVFCKEFRECAPKQTRNPRPGRRCKLHQTRILQVEHRRAKFLRILKGIHIEESKTANVMRQKMLRTFTSNVHFLEKAATTNMYMSMIVIAYSRVG
jgi:hypothetical protein